MNIRKNIDYGEMYAALDRAMVAEMEQMELYCAIGKAVSLRPEKGAAVAAAQYLTERYPEAHGFSPRNVRRMRDFYRTYENHPALLTLALQIGWTQNAVILEADLSMDLREWYLRAAKQFSWSKAELIENIAENAHEKTVLAIENDLCYSEKQESEAATDDTDKAFDFVKKIRYLLRRHKSQCISKERNKRRWAIILCPDPYGKADSSYAILKKIRLSRGNAHWPTFAWKIRLSLKNKLYFSFARDILF